MLTYLVPWFSWSTKSMKISDPPKSLMHLQYLLTYKLSWYMYSILKNKTSLQCPPCQKLAGGVLSGSHISHSTQYFRLNYFSSTLKQQHFTAILFLPLVFNLTLILNHQCAPFIIIVLLKEKKKAISYVTRKLLKHSVCPVPTTINADDAS